MDIFSRYIRKHVTTQQALQLPSSWKPELFVIIPCYKEPNLHVTLQSLTNCFSATTTIQVIVVINASEKASASDLEINQQTYTEVYEFARHANSTKLRFDAILIENLPQKWAGAGWARKIGMDLAIQLLEENHCSEGILVSLDADCTVAPDYFAQILTAFQSNPSYHFVTLNFRHVIRQSEDVSQLTEGIELYELYMRYYRHALRWSGFPHAIYTIGSSFAVRATSYAKQGGMNRKKAGEDFYFLHKLVTLGGYGEIATPLVFPEARISTRVPFGTGPVLKKWKEGDTTLSKSYALAAFSALRPLFAQTDWIFETGSPINLHPAVAKFWIDSKSDQTITTLRKNCRDAHTFRKRFFHVINAFWILKYLNETQQSDFPKEDLCAGCVKLFDQLEVNYAETTPSALLNNLRSIDETIEK